MIVDDDASVRKGLGRLFRSADFEVQTLGSAAEFLNTERPPAPACLVLDVQMPGLSGLDLQRTLATNDSHIPIIFLSAHGDIPMSVQAIKSGAVDFLTKPVDDKVLLESASAALSEDQRQHDLQKEREAVAEKLKRLTPREHDVYQLVITGMLNKQIADKLGITEATTKVHRARVMRKLEVDSLAELVKLGIK